jgi:phenylacetate-CoA ligase
VAPKTLSGRVLIPMYYTLANPRLRHWLNVKRRMQWSSPEDLSAYQRERRRDLAEFLFARVEWYRSRATSLPTAEQLARDDNAWRALPVMTKDVLTADAARVQVAGVPGTVNDSTSGSTGRNFQFRKDAEVAAATRASEFLGYEMAGSPLGERRLMLWGASRDVKQSLTLFERAKAWGLNQRDLLAYKLDAAAMEEKMREIERFAPRLILSYPNIFAQFAAAFPDRLRRVRNLRVVMTSGEMLRPEVREQIEGLTEKAVVNRYGSREFGNVAQQCERGQGLHIFMERALIEVLNENGDPCLPGEEGELVITDFDLRSMPLVRYRIGDRGVLSDRRCSCGRGFPMLAEVTGRTLDLVYGARGESIAPFFFTHLSRSVPGIRNFRVVQETMGSARVELVLGPEAQPDTVSRLVDLARNSLAASLELEFAPVSELPVSAAGKLRFIESRVAPASARARRAESRDVTDNG